MAKCSRCEEDSDRVYDLPHREVGGRQLCGSCMVATLIDREGRLFEIKGHLQRINGVVVRMLEDLEIF